MAGDGVGLSWGDSYSTYYNTVESAKVYPPREANIYLRLSSGLPAKNLGGVQLIVQMVSLSPSLTSHEKHILITHAIGEFHAKAKITQSEVFERRNAATGTHCIGSDGPENLPVDTYVSIQHLKEYDYAEQCPRSKILAALKDHNQKKEEECAEKECLDRTDAEAIVASRMALCPFQD